MASIVSAETKELVGQLFVSTLMAYARVSEKRAKEISETFIDELETGEFELLSRDEYLNATDPRNYEERD
jgi:hypothetical protein